VEGVGVGGKGLMQDPVLLKAPVPIYMSAEDYLLFLPSPVIYFNQRNIYRFVFLLSSAHHSTMELVTYISSHLYNC
jgi:hypothetical protein